MTYSAPIFGTQNTLGIDVSTAGYDQPYTVSTATPEYPQQPFSVGQVAILSQGGKALYAVASAAVTLGDVFYINQLWAAQAGLTSTNAATAAAVSQIGVAMSTMTTGQYGWFQIEGTCLNINVTASIAANSKLYTTATAGRLGAIATGSSYTVTGITVTTTSAGTAGAYAGLIQPPLAVGAAN